MMIDKQALAQRNTYRRHIFRIPYFATSKPRKRNVKNR